MGDAASSQQAMQLAKQLGIPVRCISSASAAGQYSNLLLPGEVLVLASAEGDVVLQAMREIRKAQPVSTFVVPQDLTAGIAGPRRGFDPDFAQSAARFADVVETSEARLVRSKLAGLEVEFDRVVADLIASVALGHAQGPAANWIIENSYLVQSEAEEIRRIYEGSKYRDDAKANYAQVYALALGLLRNNDHELNADAIRHALLGFQKVRPLTIAELWSFAVLLRVALLSELSCLAVASARAQQHREAAYLWADRLIAASNRGEDELSRMLTLLGKEKICNSSAFLAALSELLQGTDQALPALQIACEEWGKPLAEQVREETAQETSRAFAASLFFGSLRALSRLDLRKVFEEVSAVDHILRGDPSSTYGLSDFETRDRCRQAVERISRQSEHSETEIAHLAVEMAAGQAVGGRQGNVPSFLVTENVAELEARVKARIPLRTRVVRAARRHSTFIYFALMLGLTFSLDAAVLSLAYGFGVGNPWLLAALGSLALFPLSELALQMVHAIIISTFPPAKLCRMDFEDGIPEQFATLVVVPMMLVNENGIRNELEKLEVRFLANPNANLSYALFSDFLDSQHPEEPGDAALVQLARRGIAELNLKYPHGNFLLFHRNREWSPGENMYIGRERKRGKIEDLNSYLLGHDNASGILREGKLEHAIRYAITLDADTMLPPNAGRRLVETISHPCNEVEIDPVTRVRKSGYTIIQPRVAITLPGATATRFTRVFADTSGLDPYCRSVSDIQQDFFSEGTFHGKAIYDVRAFETILGNRFPAETLLSHDLIEGAHAGVGLATDIELLENIPLDYASFSRRQHRWIRGDWQIAPWLMPSVPAPEGRIPNPLGAVSRWRIFDNLRRSLVPVASLLLLLFGWFASVAPSVWSVVVALAIIIPALAPLLDRWARNIEGTVHGRQGASDELIRSAVLAAFLPHQAWITVDAIARVLYRRYVSRKHLLEWQTADAAEREAGSHQSVAFRQMLILGGVSATIMALLFYWDRLAPTAGFLGLWMLSPALLTWLNRRPEPKDIGQLGGSDLDYLHQAARFTWRFFDDLVNEESNWLPPDNTQLALRTEVAYRTSPTNIGLWLTSAVAANDFGWLPPDELAKRCTRTLETIDLLEKHDGHLLNWYDIKTLGALHPRYVSSVDSGNMLAALWTADRAIDEILSKPVLDEKCLRGLQTTLQILTDKASGDRYLLTDCTAAARLLRSPLREHGLVPRLRLLLHSADPFRNLSRWEASGSQSDRAYWAARFTTEVEGWTNLANKLLGWVETLSRPSDAFVSQVGKDVLALRKQALSNTPSIAALARGVPALQAIISRSKSPELAPEAAAWTTQLEAEVRGAAQYAAELSSDLKRLQLAIRRLADGTNMRTVYDETRRHFSVGNLIGGVPGAGSYYDLLASESRLTSLVSIAKGDVPIEHWFALGRPMRTEEQGRQLLSWSGTMFEYLMPLCFTHNYENSQLDFACRNAVEGQILYGRKNGVPWGISESAYSALDARQTYQYRAFGIESLAQNPDVDDRLVISPYSTMLALPLAVQESVSNLRALEGAGLKGPMGFYEAIDYSRAASREGDGQQRREGITIYAYMAHHQGMSLASLDNLLNGNAMRRRFHSDPRIRAIESLLYERIPLASLKPTKRKPAQLVLPKPAEGPPERLVPALTALPQTLLLGNGRYSVMMTNSGSGYSRWNGMDITRWRADASADQWGNFILLHEPRSRAMWSVTRQPVNGDRGEASVSFSADRAEFRRVFLGIESIMTVAVGGDEDVEVRRVTLLNRSRRVRTIDITSYAELCLAKPAADAAHPAFSKIFVETESVEPGVLLAYRRPRSAEDAAVWVAHMVVGASRHIEFETSRQTFIGRSRTLADADGMRRTLKGSTGALLDSAFALRCHETLEPRGRLELSFVTIAASSREELLRLVAKHRHPESPNRVLDLAWTHTQLEFRHLQITAEAAHRYQQLAGYLIFPVSPLRPPGARAITNGMGQRDLWALGISGDLPIITVAIREESGLKLVRELISAHGYWRARGFVADLVLLNQESGSYDRPLNFALQRLIDAHTRDVGIDKPGGVFLREASQMNEQQRTLLLNSSRAVLSGARGTLALQLPGVREPAPLASPFVPAADFPEEPSAQLPFLELAYFNGIGGFQPDGREYAIYLGPGTTTPAPWINVIGTPEFGCFVTESGLGCTWRGNSQQNRLTTWQNDPVSDPASEAIYIRDEDSGRIWTPTPLPIREDDAYRANHGQGYTRFEHNSHAIGQELTVFVPFDADGPKDTVKICRLRLQNHSSRRRTLTVTYFAEWVLGTLREEQAPHISTSFDEQTGAIFARQSWSNPSGATAFAAAVPRASSYSGDRGAFLGRNGSRTNPAGLQQKQLNDLCGGEADPAAVLQVPVSLPIGGAADVFFLLGEGEDVASVRAMLSKYQSVAAADQALANARQWWDRKLTTLQVKTPDLSVDFLLNRWLTYQTLSCRFWGRSAMYQSSGAYGFRDQLQDSLALLHVAPELSRNHILLASQHQFVEGDVQHWWHPLSGMGVRTRCSDDMLWLPFVTAKYIAFTGDTTLWDEVTGFLEGPLLEPHQQEHLFTPGPSTEHGTIWEHCRRAVDNAWRIGQHGIPLMGNGDWNDGMNMVGHEGRGESVWMAWWLITVLRMYSKLAASKGDHEWAGQCERRVADLKAAVEMHCWDGQWYLRGFFDDGSPLGSHANAEARIDSLPQSWAVISGAGDPERTRMAMESANRELVSEKDRVVKLFTPPFDKSSPHPGYIMGYPPGIRENGGQYTHGSLWLALAWARLYDGEQAVRLMQIMNPVLHCRTPRDVETYRGEPYVSAADVYTSPLQTGRAGWTWYTGSGAWMYRIWVEEILGLERVGNSLSIKPVIPATWPGFEAWYRFGSTTFHVQVFQSQDAGSRLELDGQVLKTPTIPLVDDGREHTVRLVLGSDTEALKHKGEQQSVPGRQLTAAPHS